MQLIRCHIENFGRLSDVNLDFQSGLNVLYRRNGWGKSSLAVFICAMFYGLANDRKHGESDNERKHYMPWQGGTFGGNLTFSNETGEYTIYRTFGSKARDDTFELRDEKTNLFTTIYSDAIGEEIFQLDRESFVRTAFLFQDACETVSTSGINAKIHNLAEDTNDMNNYDMVSRRLQQEMVSLGEDRATGTIARLKAQEKKLREAVQTGPVFDRKLAELSGQRQNLKQQLNAIETKQEEMLRLQSQTDYLRACEEVRERKSVYERGRNFFHGMIPTDEDMEKQEELLRETEDLRKEREAYMFSVQEQEEFRRLDLQFSGKILSEQKLQEQQESLARIAALQQKIEELNRENISGMNHKEFSEKMSESSARLPADKMENRFEEPDEDLEFIEFKTEDKTGDKTKEKIDNKTVDEVRRKGREGTGGTEEMVPTGGDTIIGRVDRMRNGIFLIAGIVIIVIGIIVIGLGYLIPGTVVILMGAGMALWMIWKLVPDVDIDKMNLTGVMSSAGKKWKGFGKGREKEGKELGNTDGVRRSDCEEDSDYEENPDFEENPGYVKDPDYQENPGLIPDDRFAELALAQEEITYRKASVRKFLEKYTGTRVPDSELEVVLDKIWDDAERYRELAKRCQDFADITEKLRENIHLQNAYLRRYIPARKGESRDMMSVSARLRRIQNARTAYFYAVGEYENSKRKAEKLKRELEETTGEIVPEGTIAPENLAEMLKEASDLRVSLERQIQKYDYEIGKIQTARDEAVAFSAELAKLQEEITEKEHEYEVLRLTSEILTEARNNFNAKYLKPIMRTFLGYYRIINPDPEEGEQFFIDGDSKITVLGGAKQRETALLSKGYQDMIGLCIRMALLDAMYPAEKPFLVMDDPLVNLDDIRFRGGIDFLKTVSEKYQIIFLTCHEKAGSFD